MNCPNCGTDFNGKFCPNCGAYLPEPQPEQKLNRANSMRYVVIAAAILAVGMIAAALIIVVGLRANDGGARSVPNDSAPEVSASVPDDRQSSDGEETTTEELEELVEEEPTTEKDAADDDTTPLSPKAFIELEDAVEPILPDVHAAHDSQYGVIDDDNYVILDESDMYWMIGFNWKLGDTSNYSDEAWSYIDYTPAYLVSKLTGAIRWHGSVQDSWDGMIEYALDGKLD